MKVSVMGSAQLLDNGEISVPIILGKGTENKKIFLTLSPNDAPLGSWITTINSRDAHRISTLSSPKHSLWLYRGNIVEVSDSGSLTDEELKLEVAHVVLSRDKRYNMIRRQIEAYCAIEGADRARREVIPEKVRLFVWQRDEGKCVKCGNSERLEFDHIIPVSKGGSNTERNIQLLCEQCNREKGANI